MSTGSFPEVNCARGVTLTPHPLLVAWSRKSIVIPLLVLWAVRPVQSLSACIRVHFTFYFYPPMKMEQTKRRHIKFRRRGITQKIAYNFCNYFQISDIFLTIHFQKSGKLNSRSVLKDMTEDGRRSSALGLQEMNTFYRGADKSLALPGRKQSRKHVTDARDFNNIETRAVIKFFFSCKERRRRKFTPL